MRRAPALWILFACVAGFAAGGLAVETGPVEFRPSEVGATLRTPRFHLRSVEITGLERLDASSLRQRLQLREGRPLIDVDPDEICGRLLGHARIVECTALRLPPDTLWLDVVERVPIARLGASSKGVDAEGVRVWLSAAETRDLPRIDGSPSWALPLLALASERGLAVTSVDARGSSDLIVRLRGVSARLRVGRDLERALRNWSRIADLDTRELRSATEIDLRFGGGAVLRSSKNQRGEKSNGAS